MRQARNAFTADAEEKALVDYTRLMHANQKLTNAIAGRTVCAVGQQEAALSIEFSDGSTLHIKLADPASSVMLRDKAGKLEYAD
jgi:hypothetical protein